ncbi:response regulator transcription factor [Streptosporangium sp. NPDC051022]|uniref:response regulator transcription factor n=1 Tax=Streptosporangium sp. NPDC051022 TaxID=3155752 RepID=UPI003432BD26
MKEPAPARVLIVDDEPNIRELLSSALRMSGFEVSVAACGIEAMEGAGRDRPDIVILDVMLPDLDGFTVARRLRALHDGLPVLFLTARDAVTDRIAGLTAGGDDYVTKPFSLEEVILRLRAILRRSRPPADLSADGVLRYADLELDEKAHTVRRAERTVHLSPTEFNLLRYLMVNAERVVSKTQILDRVWNYGFGGDSRIVESYISYLRRKIDAEGPALIHTLRGVGYSLRLHPAAGATSRDGSPLPRRGVAPHGGEKRGRRPS